MRYVIEMVIGDSLGNVYTKTIPLEADQPFVEILREFFATYTRLTKELNEIWTGKTSKEYNIAWYENLSKVMVNGKQFDYSAVFYAPEVGDPVKKVMTIDEWFEH
jgi:hypothetical protein